jgi:hypothetical protein
MGGSCGRDEQVAWSRWSNWFDNLSLSQEYDGTTGLIDQRGDQAALFQPLGRLRDLGATLLSVARLADGEVWS